MNRIPLSTMISAALALPLLALLSIPLITLLGGASSIGWLITAPAGSSAIEALTLSLQTSGLSALAIALMGTPLAWLMARKVSRGGLLLRVMVMTPMFLPPSVVGLTLLSAFNREGWLGSLSESFSEVPFSVGAVMIAQVTVAAPLYILGAMAVFKRSSPELLEMARTLGLNPWEAWRRVTLPLLSPGLLIALSLCWARALGEFGATLLFAGHLPGVTQTAPLAIYLELERGTVGALAISIGLIGYMIPILVALAWLGQPRWARLE